MPRKPLYRPLGLGKADWERVKANARRRELARAIVDHPNTISSVDSDNPSTRYSLVDTATALAKLVLEADDGTH